MAHFSQPEPELFHGAEVVNALKSLRAQKHWRPTTLRVRLVFVARESQSCNSLSTAKPTSATALLLSTSTEVFALHLQSPILFYSQTWLNPVRDGTAERQLAAEAPTTTTCADLSHRPSEPPRGDIRVLSKVEQLPCVKIAPFSRAYNTYVRS